MPYSCAVTVTLCSPGHWNWIIQFKFICPSAVFQNNFNFSILIPILSCSPDSLLMISMDATFCSFLFHDYRIERCGLQLKEFVELAPLLPKLSQLEALRYNSCSKHSFTSVYLLPCQVECHSFFSTVIGKFAHWSCMCTLYNRCTPYSQWEYASYHTL